MADPVPLLQGDLRRFSLEAYPSHLKDAASRDALQKVLLSATPLQAGKSRLTTNLTLRRSSLDSVFVRLDASPQALEPHETTTQRYGHAVLAILLLEGSGAVLEGADSVELSREDILVLDPARPWRIELRTHCRLVVIKLESASFLLRLVRTSRHNLNKIATRDGVGMVCLQLTRSISDEIDRISEHELLSMEAMVTEALVTCLSHEGEDASRDSTSVQLSHLRRVCRTIEARLGDPDLSADEIGRTEGLSTRYIQKLFKAGTTTFGEYLRTRRLERCRADLHNRALDHFTISELCFRWGFNDAANFSRAFSAQFGMSPKACRQVDPRSTGEAPTQRGSPSTRGSPPQGPRPGAEFERAHLFREVIGDHTRYAQAVTLSPKRAREAGEESKEVGGEGGSRAPDHFYVPVSAETIHWGYFSRDLKPVLTVQSGDVVTMETLTQHASDDAERMIHGDAGAESVFRWTADGKGVERRGAGPLNAGLYGRGAGEGFGVHICTGPVYVRDAEPGDVLEIQIEDIRLRPSRSPSHRGRCFGSNAAAWWGFHYHDLITEPRRREVVTIFEIEGERDEARARALYNFRWTPQVDPDGVRHETIDYPGVVVDHQTITKREGVLKHARIPVLPHFGVLAVAPREHGLIDSIPPGYFGGNLDNWRAGKGAKLFLPVSAPGALFSVGDPHASQGDSELCGTAIECSLTGVFRLVLHKKPSISDPFFSGLNSPFLETPTEWVLHGFSVADHLGELGPAAQSEIYRKSSLESAMKDAFSKTRRYLMEAHGLDEDEAIALISVAVDFGITQIVDGNWGVHAIIKKEIFPAYRNPMSGSP